MPDTPKHFTVDLIRHGEPRGGERIRGQIDDPLSGLGLMQMREALKYTDRDWEMIVSSSLSRCSEFAMELNRERKIPVVIDDRFIEIGFGEWEGKSKDEIDPERRQFFKQDPELFRPAGAELLQDFVARVREARDDMLDRFRGENLLVVTHAGVIRALICEAQKQDMKQMFTLQVPYANITRLEYDNSYVIPRLTNVILNHEFRQPD